MRSPVRSPLHSSFRSTFARLSLLIASCAAVFPVDSLFALPPIREFGDGTVGIECTKINTAAPRCESAHYRTRALTSCQKSARLTRISGRSSD